MKSAEGYCNVMCSILLDLIVNTVVYNVCCVAVQVLHLSTSPLWIPHQEDIITIILGDQ